MRGSGGKKGTIFFMINECMFRLFLYIVHTCFSDVTHLETTIQGGIFIYFLSSITIYNHYNHNSF